jgi:hypothetical protein
MLIPFGVLSAAGAGGVAGDYELIESVILGTDTSSITFSSLATYASTYKHLQVRMTARSSRNTGTFDSVSLRLNGDTGSNYAWHRLVNDGGSVISTASTSQTAGRAGSISQANSTANIYGAIVIDLLDPYSTTKNTTVRSLMGVVSPNEISLISSLYNNTSAISSFNLFSETSNNFLAGSRFSLYGIRG